MFESLEGKSLVELEEKVLQEWKDQDIFAKSLKMRRKHPLFSFFDGPPFATGLPHYGHILASTIKDVVARYKTMQGYHVPRRFGWDCHGLPVENEIEKHFQLKGAHDIEAFGVSKFNEECRKIVMRYSEEWQETISRLGRWVDFDQTYHTMDATYMESIWWVFSELYKKDLIYQGYKVMPYSAKLGTPLSNFEANLNYKDVDDPSIVVAFPLKEEPQTQLLIWTTTPWTLISNLAACVGRDIVYVRVKDHKSQNTYILAKSRLSAYFTDESEYTLDGELRADDLEGVEYLPPFDYFKDKGAFRVLIADFVNTENGTGIVHTAPGFGEDDFYVCKEAKIDPVCPVDTNCKFTDEVPEYEGQFVKDADKEIIASLKSANRLFYRGTIRHRYPFCWRTDTPLIYRVTTSWFVAVEKIKDKVIEANKGIYWMPNHIKNGRFGKWLEGARDWAVSRNRYWGTPIPIWEAEDGERIVIGSLDELKKYTGEKVNDLHRHFIDHLEFKDKKGKVFKRTTGVFDCWFESGSMPYAQNHYPFENKNLLNKIFPADFIAEGLDQTRGWFYTLTVLGAALFDSRAFKNTIVNGIILAEDGQKMSKRLKNYPDPMEVVNSYGADALRLYLLSSPVVKGEDMRFKQKGVEQTFRQTLLPFWNAHNFFITYVRIYQWKPSKNFRKPHKLLDRWVISRLNHLINAIEKAMDTYDLSGAIEPIIQFMDELTNWYIRRSRRRFWNSEATDDRDEAFSTLYTVLVEACKIIAPFVPFLSDVIYKNLVNTDKEVESIHLCDYSIYRTDWRSISLEKQMSALQSAVSLAHSLRKENRLKVRQPLAKMHIAIGSENEKEFLESQAHLMRDELNVKDIIFYEDERELVELKPIPNFRVLGKKVGKLMKAVQAKIQELDHNSLQDLFEDKTVILTIDDQEIELLKEDIQIQREVKGGMVAANVGDITLALDTHLTEELLIEGIARELVNKIQTMRRDAKLEKTDRIHLKLATTDRVKQTFETFKDYIQEEVLATRVEFLEEVEGVEWDVNSQMTTIALSKETSQAEEA